MRRAAWEEGVLDERESFIDATFAEGTAGAAIPENQRWQRRRDSRDCGCHLLPLSVSTHAANHHEVTLVQLSFNFYMLEGSLSI